MPYENNHYIPRFILRRFGDRINRFNLETGEFKCKGSLWKAFSSKNIYPEWLEHMLSDLETRMANLIDAKVLKAEGMVTLIRSDNWLIKKFFTVATLRVPESSLMSKRHLDSVEDLKRDGFKETTINGESDLEYAYRTLKVILESNSLDEVYNHPLVTYEACKWATLFNNCYVSIWDSTNSREDFVIADNGMTCEHDKSRFKTLVFDGQPFFNVRDEMLKKGYVIKKIKENETSNQSKAIFYYQILLNMNYVHANYYLFAVSDTRTISLINPFFRLYDDPHYLKTTGEVPNVWPTLLSREAMKCNSQVYKEFERKNNDDLFIYEIKNISFEDVVTINAMMLDRVFRWLGFDDSAKIVRSLNVYSLIDKAQQRNHFDKLIEQLQSLGYEFPNTKKYKDLADRLLHVTINEAEYKYIKYFFDLIIKKQ